MAMCETMAYGLPSGSLKLSALGTYYPKGMLKNRCYDLKEFADNILKLLNDGKPYKRTTKDALDWAKHETI